MLITARRALTVCSILAIAASGTVGSAIAAESGVSEPVVALEVAVRGTQDEVKPPPPPPIPDAAQYQVTLNVNWTSSTHPGTVPSGAHTSPPLAVSHSTPGALFERETLASPGIEIMAESGGLSTLQVELSNNFSVHDLDTSTRVDGSGSRTMMLELTQSADLISMVTMLAPSPDWFIGFRNRDMFVDGDWVDTVTFDLSNYDAGTDSGPAFVSANADTNPAQVISGPREPAFANAANQNPFASVTITRIP